MWPYVQINNLNQMQGPTTSVERHLLFIGSAASNTGKLRSLLEPVAVAWTVMSGCTTVAAAGS